MAAEKQNTEQLRAQAALLLSQANAQSLDIQRALGAASGNGTLHSRLAAAAAQISGVASALSQALSSSSFPLRAADLMALESTVHSGEASSLLTEAAAQAGTHAAGAPDLAAASADTRREVESLAHDVFDRRIFDPYLHFSSAEDEAAFRKREAEAKKYIDDQLERGTPEGNLNAGGGMIGEMLDAHAHGAGDSPEFMPRWNELVEKTQRQRAAMHAAGQSTEEYDGHVTASARRFLKDEKHMSDAEIDRRLAATANPLDAVKPFLGNDHESRLLENQSRRAGHIEHATTAPLPQVEAGGGASVPNPTTAMNFGALATKLKGAVVATADNGDADPHHGLTAAKPSGKGGPGVAG